MFPIIFINIANLLAITYYCIKIYRIKNFLSFERYKNNWYPSLGINGYKLSYVMFNINTAYTIVCSVMLWIYFAGIYYREKNNNYLLGISILLLLVTKMFMIFIGKKVLPCIEDDVVSNNGQEIEISISQPIQWEFSIRNNDNDIFRYECCICLENKLFPYKAILFPCKHDFFCKTCIETVNNYSSLEYCPLCRMKINKVGIIIRKN